MRVTSAAVQEVSSDNIVLTDPTPTQGREASPGDLMIASIVYRDSVAFTLPAGWSLVSAQQSAGNTTIATAASKSSGLIAYIVRGTSAPDTTFVRVAGGVAQGCIDVFRRVDYGVPVYDTGSDNVLSSASTVVTTGTITTTDDDELIFVLGALARNVNPTVGYTGAQDMMVNFGVTTGLTVTAGPVLQDKFMILGSTGTNTGAGSRHTRAIGVKRRAGPTGTISLTVASSALHVMITGAFRALTS